MPDAAYLLLEDGTVYRGKPFGARGTAAGEIVFTTTMAGYLETLTDPCYTGQIVIQTFPLAGNYGVIPEDFESGHMGVNGYIAKNWCQEPSNFRSEGNLDTFLKSRGVTGLYGIDTRELVKRIRENGVMNGRIQSGEPNAEDLAEIKNFMEEYPVGRLSVKEAVNYGADGVKATVAMLDFGAGEKTRRELSARGYGVWVFPHDACAEEIMKAAPRGVALTGGPGNPEDVRAAIESIKKIAGTGIPIMGFGLGHQLLAIACGFKVFKLKYGHRGSNQPVKDAQSGKVYITTQNHGYAVVSESVDEKTATVSYINLNDNTCEGITYKSIPAATLQFVPDTEAGPRSFSFLFDKFKSDMEGFECR